MGKGPAQILPDRYGQVDRKRTLAAADQLEDQR
jgi:hypothetical protein